MCFSPLPITICATAIIGHKTTNRLAAGSHSEEFATPQSAYRPDTAAAHCDEALNGPDVTGAKCVALARGAASVIRRVRYTSTRCRLTKGRWFAPDALFFSGVMGG